MAEQIFEADVEVGNPVSSGVAQDADELPQTDTKQMALPFVATKSPNLHQSIVFLMATLEPDNTALGSAKASVPALMITCWAMAIFQALCVQGIGRSALYSDCKTNDYCKRGEYNDSSGPCSPRTSVCSVLCVPMQVGAHVLSKLDDACT